MSKPVNWGLSKFFDLFNWFFDVTIAGYGGIVGLLIKLWLIVLPVYGGMIFLTYLILQMVPVGFIPEQDKGYLVLNAQLPDGANLDRSDELIRKLSKIARETEGVSHTIDLPGYSTILSTNISNVGGMFIILAPFEERAGKPELGAVAIIAKLRQKFAEFQEAKLRCSVRRLWKDWAVPADSSCRSRTVAVQVCPPCRERCRTSPTKLQSASPDSSGVFSTFSVTQPQLFAEIDREKAKAASVSLDDIHATLQTYLGSSYVNDFSFQNRNWQVNVQADPRFRMRIEDIGKLEVRNAAGVRVPLGTFIKLRNTSGPSLVNHYNLLSVCRIERGHSSGCQFRTGNQHDGVHWRDGTAFDDGL